MMRFTPQPEPPKFDERCRRRGQMWLREHQGYDGRPPDYWSEFENEVRQEFHGLCAYCVMRVMKANVDHFIPIARLKREGRDHLVYEWNNFRYGEGVLNQRKQDHRILDPFEVRDNWFQLLLPSLQLVLNDHVPKRFRKLAEFTIVRLGLRDDEVVVRYREEWFKMYREGNLTLEGLFEIAPLIARAVELDLAGNKDWRLGQ